MTFRMNAAPVFIAWSGFRAAGFGVGMLAVVMRGAVTVAGAVVRAAAVRAAVTMLGAAAPA